MNVIDLVKEEYSFGRDEDCDYCFEARSSGKKLFLTLSKTHFRIFRVSSSLLKWAELTTCWHGIYHNSLC